MGRPRILPPGDELVRVFQRDSSLTYTAVARRYGVTRQAVVKALGPRVAQLNRPPARSLKLFVPWRVRVEHEQDFLVRMLRLYAREQLGFGVASGRRRGYYSWKREMDDRNLVVTYDRETGFALDERREGDAAYWRP